MGIVHTSILHLGVNLKMKRLPFFSCYDVVSKETVGCYSLDPDPLCNSVAILIDGGPWNGTITELFEKFNGGRCTFPNGSFFTHEFPEEYDEEFPKKTGIASEFQCRIGYSISALSTFTAIIFLVGIILDETWGLIDEIYYENEIWKKYIRLASYFMTFTTLIIGNIMVIITHVFWIIKPNQSTDMNQWLYNLHESPCKTPSRIGLLMVIVASYLLAVEIGEAIFNLGFRSSFGLVKSRKNRNLKRISRTHEERVELIHTRSDRDD